ncbi:MAG: hypothetical protein LBF39_05015 [Prevotellaceae bacterium]|jgi:hypothetical protein|nr:hypothetical protein [Prevotellaceae bacterium]
MALETRPVPVLKGKAARDFFETLKKCTVSESREEVQEINRWVRESLEKARKRETQKGNSNV